MQPISQEYISSVCEIKTLENDFLSVGVITKITDEYLQIGSYHDERLPLIAFDSPVKVLMHNLRAGFRVIGGVAYLSTDKMLRVVEVKNLQDFERRGFFRVPTRLAGNATVKDSFTEEFEDKFNITIENLSLSGILFSIPDENTLSIGDVFLLGMAIPTGTLEITCRVRRIEARGTRPPRYGCEFFDHSQRDADKLCGYIFELQREMIRKKKKL